MRFLMGFLKLNQDKENMKIPKSVQKAIPIKRIYENGTFQVGRNNYSKSYRFTDINYIVADKEEQEMIAIDYGSILNLLDYSLLPKITIVNRKLNGIDFENKI